MITDPKALSKAARAIRFYPHHTQIGGLLIVPAHASAHGALASITTTKAFATLWHHLLFAGHKRPFPFVLETYPWKP